jgi:hypothetical protein
MTHSTIIITHANDPIRIPLITALMHRHVQPIWIDPKQIFQWKITGLLTKKQHQIVWHHHPLSITNPTGFFGPTLFKFNTLLADFDPLDHDYLRQSWLALLWSAIEHIPRRIDLLDLYLTDPLRIHPQSLAYYLEKFDLTLAEPHNQIKNIWHWHAIDQQSVVSKEERQQLQLGNFPQMIEKTNWKIKNDLNLTACQITWQQTVDDAWHIQQIHLVPKWEQCHLSIHAVAKWLASWLTPTSPTEKTQLKKQCFIPNHLRFIARAGRWIKRLD